MGNGPFKIACTLWREGDVAIFDFTGIRSAVASPRSTSCSTKRCSRCSSAPSRSTSSTRRSCSTTGSTTSSTCASPQAASSSRRSRRRCPAAPTCSGRIFDLMGGLLGQGAPDALNAAGFSDSPHFMYSGFDKEGRMVPALPDRLRRRARPARRRRPGRPLDVARLHQRAERVPRGLFPAAHPRPTRPSRTRAARACIAAATASSSPTRCWKRARSRSTTTAG